MNFFVISVHYDLDLRREEVSVFFVREAEVANISVPKADNVIIQFNSHNFSPVDLINK